MQIRQIHIDGFGVWHGKTWSGLGAGFNVFHGPNETGKTTLMGFIRSVLFGFERRTSPGRYEPQNGGRYGGWLEVRDDGSRARIERKAGRHVRGRVRIRNLNESSGEGSISQSDESESDQSGQINDETRLERMLGGTTRTLYHNVFAFGLEELEHFRTLQESEVASHISGAGMGVGAARWSRVWKDIEDRRGRLFLPRGQNSTINRALKELASAQEELRQVENQPEDYIRAHEERARLEAELRQLENESERLRKAIDHSKRIKAAEPHRKRRAAIREELDRLELVEEFPEGGVERLNLLLHQRRELEGELDRQREESGRLRAKRLQLVSSYSPQQLIRLGRDVESLRSLLPRRETIEARVVSAEAMRNALLSERDAAIARRDAERPPSRAAVAVFWGVVLLGATGLYLTGYRVGAAALAGPLAAFVYWYYRRKRSWRTGGNEVRAVEERLEQAETQLEQVLGEGRGVAASIERLVGRSDFTHADLERESLKVQELNETADRIRSIDEALAGEQKTIERVRARIQANEQAVLELFRKGGAASESEFFRRSELFGERRRLEVELAQIPVADMAPGPQPSDVEPSDADPLPNLLAEWERLQSKLTDRRTEIGRMVERIAVLSRSEERSRARLRQESILARLDSAAEDWAVLTLCRTLLEDTRRVYETERQPKVLEHASEFFSRMTDGAWTRVISSLDSSQVLVESRRGDRLSPEVLSRGTAEQLYLAMRLALVREYSTSVKALPVILDDVFVNFDPDRMRRSVEAVSQLSQTHQILLFTCHPHLVEMVEEIVPGAEIYLLQ